ncbi:30S ribosomal protein S8 [Patescibacteria group bacterium]|nr:30S ribosomal protein S8 [Patescibacteria group bacterium]MBU4274926.1 30S ribosomal protein S8 [Patescibacteria group bacterium]MBU4367892.1 30S ribosomal protein S8 [Patescibacteria group bacterium]MBU4461931.1 30S ribosomal protein S8 [Patescibacteria group bacterium]MCG2699874.1 30S ribosomal protein S8 [Candidatus Parcubacteria bacterium]
MSDPITDMLNQIRNAQAVAKTEVFIPFSRLKQEIAKILVEEGFLGDIKKTPKKDDRILKIALKYNQDAPAISSLKRISKPGNKVYIQTSDIRAVRGGRGITIISTSKGLMTNKKARKERLGGEVICEVW